ncbi:hypothetical protein BN341_12700 [Helicobacter heilmannii ASB1.4]|uniref:Uncharacterized protein n=1 Tax=Helicobacter heilmannii TaxID=35817 RepID=A0A0K2Y6U8_HELHE|nr:hypothetical protein BN341_12700 [Helicobacter heilmannii ASB1.4]CRI34896.1 hypothetical protein HHE01_06970 [Helicobacter heilmannii]
MSQKPNNPPKGTRVKATIGESLSVKSKAINEAMMRMAKTVSMAFILQSDKSSSLGPFS